jgi:hypothetical protein
MKKSLAVWMFWATPIIFVVRFLDRLIDLMVVDFLNWLGKHWEFMSGHYEPMPGFFVAVCILAYTMYEIDALRVEMKKRNNP